MNPLPLFKCLSDDTRLKIVLMLTQTDTLCVCDLQQTLQLSQPKVSRHLAELRKCGLLDDERRGKWVYYSLAKDLADWQAQVIRITADNNADYLAELNQSEQGCQAC